MMDVPALMVEMATVPKTITLDTLANMEVFQRVTVNVKVVGVKETIQLSNKVKKDVLLTDKSGTAKVSLWEEHMNAMKEQESYCLNSSRI